MIGVGGGVILDAVGFAAQQYRRMISYYRIPTTLVGQIDAGVGIKVGINYKRSKNLLGSFYPPSLVINCTDFLFSLPQEDFICGISEILKAGIADCPQIVSAFSHSETVFSPLSLQKNSQLMEDFQIVMDLAIQTMLMNLQSNFYEQKELRRLMDFGHTFSPIIEGKSDYRIPHGFAVAIDMFICIYISRCLQLISDELFLLYQSR
jgi:3-dehydroquinate synthase